MYYLRERELSPTRPRIPCYLVELEAPVLNRVTNLRPRPGWYHKVLWYRLRARCRCCGAEMPFALNPDEYCDNYGAYIQRWDPVEPRYHWRQLCSGGCMAVCKVIILERGGRDLTPENNVTPVLKLQVVGDFILLPAEYAFIGTLWHYTRPAVLVHHPTGEFTLPPRRVRRVVLNRSNPRNKIRLVVRIRLIQYIDEQFSGLLDERQIEALPGTTLFVPGRSPNASD